MGRASLHLIVNSLFVAGCVLTVSGCSGRPKNVAKKVSGTVTLGGQPLADALVTFAPSSGNSSASRTDAQGHYNLIYAGQGKRRIEGAVIGEHRVYISTFQFGDASAKPPKPDVAEKVPYKYRQDEGALTATVKAGANVIDFQLEPGPVEPPQPKGKTKAKAKGK